jgi:hypothetical protein
MDEAQSQRKWARRRRIWGIVMAFALLALGGSVYLNRELLSIAGVALSMWLFALAYVRIRICPRCRRFVSRPGDRRECPHCGLRIREVPQDPSRRDQ